MSVSSISTSPVTYSGDTPASTFVGKLERRTASSSDRQGLFLSTEMGTFLVVAVTDQATSALAALGNPQDGIEVAITGDLRWGFEGYVLEAKTIDPKVLPDTRAPTTNSQRYEHVIWLKFLDHPTSGAVPLDYAHEGNLITVDVQGGGPTVYRIVGGQLAPVAK